MARGKNFKEQIDNPAMAFISTPQAQGTDTAEASAPIERKGRLIPPPGYKVDHRFVETKSRRAQFLLQPSVFAKLQARAAAEGISVNELVNSIIIDALEG